MKTEYKTTLQDLLHAINVIGNDVDVYVDGIDSIAVCPPVTITPEGREHFTKALNTTTIMAYEDGEHDFTYVSGYDDKADNEAWALLTSLAGYCGDTKFNEWFQGETAELI